MDKLRGVGVALVTPFQEDGNIDYKGLEALINHVLKGGVDYVVLQGTTGESPTISTEEKQALLAFTHEVVQDRVPLVFGYGGNNTKALLDGMDAYDWDKVDAVLSVSPYYNKPNASGLYSHFQQLAEALPKPIILYNVPGRTGSNMPVEVVLRLAEECESVVAIKEASADLGQMAHLIDKKPDGFLVLSGDDDLVLPQMAMGADGVISVIANALPKRFSTLVHAALEGDLETAREYHYLLREIIPWLFVEGNPSGIKAALRMLGLCGDTVRLPLAPVSEATYQQLYRAISEAGISLD